MEICNIEEMQLVVIKISECWGWKNSHLLTYVISMTQPRKGICKVNSWSLKPSTWCHAQNGKKESQGLTSTRNINTWWWWCAKLAILKCCLKNLSRLLRCCSHHSYLSRGVYYSITLPTFYSSESRKTKTLKTKVNLFKIEKKV